MLPISRRAGHSVVNHLLQSSGDVRAVQGLLVHSNTTTQINTRLDCRHPAKVYDTAYPRTPKKSA
ncbi:tyrosine recombinase XerC subunit [Acidovorax delafieldii 2AN]|uniref:Tyrosine recombinase XerC subunit n=1 Tax=Acidovorax delafieldii 2AN TaxID=573060 RepID=C5T5I4_ACIDE|nr:tyrosine recombinase XerC subunit [Acidovorax delafieldii 2AN]